MTEINSQFVSPAELQIGMYIYLDIGWMDHPFPVNSFEIHTQDQINKLRGLGLQKIRYAPEKSHLKITSATPAASPTPELHVTNETPEELAAKQRKAQLHQQQASLMQCERQFGQATQEFKHLTEIIHAQPLLARDTATKLIQGMLEGMLNMEESAIRLLSEKAGEKTALHSVNVTLISLLLGKALELPKDDMLELGIGALLHDVGKMELPDRLRWVDEQSSPAERQLYQSHVAHGVNIARKLQLSTNATLLIAQHHEYADGSGYPAHIHGEKMTGLSRIISLVNRFDNLCNPNNVAHAVTPHEALSQLFTKNKTQSDTPTLTAFIKMMGIYPPGSVVQLSDERYALVVSVNSSRPIKPKVIIHDPHVPREDALVINLEHEPQIGIRRSLKPIQLPKAAYDYLSPRKRLCYFFERASDPLSLACNLEGQLS
ncbi:MAG: HD-GYP domain-containing protein [Candidatus Aquirickettsiella gammari]